MTIYQRTLLIATALLPAMTLGACVGGTPNRGLESVHQPVVSRADYMLDVATSGSGLAPGEENRLAGWMASLRLGYGDQVAIDDPNPYGGGVRDQVAREVARYGLLIAEDAPITTAPVARGTARIIVSRMRASVPGCPDFSRGDKPEFESNTTSNQGCAINSNIAAMVASPSDLVRGQAGASLTDPATSGKAIDLFRKTVPSGAGGTAIKVESTAGGK